MYLVPKSIIPSPKNPLCNFTSSSGPHMIMRHSKHGPGLGQKAEGKHTLYIYICIYVCIYICCRVNNLAIISQQLGHLFFVVFLLFKNILLSAGRMRFLKKKQVLTKKKSVKKVGSITWPSFWAKFWPKRWPSYWPYHGQVIDPTFWPKKLQINISKSSTNPIFIVFFEQQAKKQENSPKKKQ